MKSTLNNVRELNQIIEISQRRKQLELVIYMPSYPSIAHKVYMSTLDIGGGGGGEWGDVNTFSEKSLKDIQYPHISYNCFPCSFMYISNGFFYLCMFQLQLLWFYTDGILTRKMWKGNIFSYLFMHVRLYWKFWLVENDCMDACIDKSALVANYHPGTV